MKAEEIAHWLHWYKSVDLKALLMSCEEQPDGSTVIPPDVARNLRNSIGTSFKDLSEDEQEVLMRFARRFGET